MIVVSLAFYLFYKIKYFRTKMPIEKRWIQMKGNIALGIFLVAFALNLLIMNRSTVDLVIGGLFLVLGVANVILGYRAYRYYT
ncbi:hypothetical protein AOA57_29695, partial [Pseudomonas sp. 2588-5]